MKHLCWLVCAIFFNVSLSVIGQRSQDNSLAPEKKQQLLQERAQLMNDMRSAYLSKQDKKLKTILFRMIEVEKQIYGETHDNVVTRLQQVGQVFELVGDWEQARKQLDEAIRIQLQVYGKEHWKTQDAQRAKKDLEFRQTLKPEDWTGLSQAKGLNIQVGKLLAAGQFQSAIAPALKAVELRRKIQGEKHPDYAQALNNLGYAHMRNGEFDKAVSYLEQAVSKAQQSLGTQHPQYARFLINLATVYKEQDEYKKALPRYKQALHLAEKLLGTRHPDYLMALNSMAIVYQKQGKYEQALESYHRALSITEQIVGRKDSRFASILHNLAIFYHSQGKYAIALPMEIQVLALRKELLGSQHPDYADSVNALASMYDEQGEYDQSLPLHQLALAIRKQVLGENHPDYATSLNNLAMVYMNQKKYDKALPLYQKALSIRKEVLVENHPAYATPLNNLGGLYQYTGEYDKALPLYQQALALLKKSKGEKEPKYILCLSNVAWIYIEQKKYNKGIPLLQQAAKLTQETLGDNHPDYAKALANLGAAYYGLANYQRAEEYALKSATIYDRHRSAVSREGLQRASHFSKHSPQFWLVDILARNKKPQEAWQWLERSLGRATWDEVTARSRRTAKEQQRVDQLQGSIQQIEQRLDKLGKQSRLSEDQQQLQKKWLTAQSQHYAELQKLYEQLKEKYGLSEGKSYSLKLIQAELDSDSAFLTWLDVEQERWVVLVRSTGTPIFKRITGTGQDGNWTPDDIAVSKKFYQNLRSQKGSTSSERDAIANKLRQLRIQPIEQQLQEVKHVIVLPSIGMDGIPIELILPRKRVSYAPSATIYTWLQQQSGPKGKKLLALGDPIYNPQEENSEKNYPESGILITTVIVDSLADRAKLEAGQVLLEYEKTTLNSIDDLHKAIATHQVQKEVRIKVWHKNRVFEKVIPTGKLGVVLSRESVKVALQNRRKQQWQLVSRGEKWNALPGTRIEVTSIANLVDQSQRQVFLDSIASEQQLHQLASAEKLKEFRYLHFATHGLVNRITPMESALILSQDSIQIDNSSVTVGQPFFDGRLTAKEVALHWNLDAGLVTLSACNSGLGRYARGEGYIGFAQSFLIRGSRSVVLSLWSVDDTATALLMKRFYENLIKHGMTKIDALCEAKKWLRTLPRSEVLKHTAKMSNGVARGPGRKKLPPLSKVPMSAKEEDTPYAHPYYWSAFILIGSPD